MFYVGFFSVWLDRYKDALVLLLSEVLNRIQFRYNQAQLEELDDETLDDDVRAFSIFSVVMFSVCYLYILTITHSYSYIYIYIYLKGMYILSNWMFLISNIMNPFIW